MKARVDSPQNNKSASFKKLRIRDGDASSDKGSQGDRNASFGRDTLPPLNASLEFRANSPMRKSITRGSSQEKLPHPADNKNLTMDKFVGIDLM